MAVDPISLAIVFLVKSASSWLPALGETLLNSDVEAGQKSLFGWFLRWQKRREQVLHLQRALGKAAVRGVSSFRTPPERDQFRDILSVLAQPGFHNEELRREALRLFTLSDAPDLQALSDIYNRARRVQTLAQPQPSVIVDATLYLSAFFSALFNELYNDEVFGDQVRQVLDARAAKTTQERLPQIAEGIQDLAAGMRQLLQTMAPDYTAQQFEQDVTTYLSYVERTYDSLKLPRVIPEELGDQDAELEAIFVPQHILLLDAVQSRKQEYDSVASLLQSSPYVVLLGGPGTGKSTVTRYLAWSHATARLLHRATGNLSLLPGKPIPLRIELHDFSEISMQQPDSSFFSYMTEIVLERMNIHVAPQMFDVLLKQNALLFLFDGLDEVVDAEERRRLIDAIEEVAQRYRGNSILVTSRPVGYELFGFSTRWFTHGTLQEFDDEQIRLFLSRWYTYVLRLSPLPYDDQKELESLYETLKGNARLHTLARNPLLLTIITTLHRTERLPDRRVHVYDRCADLLLDTWARRRGTNGRWQGMQMTRDVQRACIAHLGFILYERLQDENNAGGEGSFCSDCLTLPQMQAEVERFLKSRQLFSAEERQVEAERFLDLMRTETGLIVKRGKDDSGEDLYGFIHEAFQEYFAALDVYFRQADPPHPDRPDEDANSILNTFLTQHLHDPHWQEVILLLFGKLGPGRATTQLQLILDPVNNKVCCRSTYTAILQQDLFFACSCLKEEITVQNRLVSEIVTRLSEVIATSPFPSQRNDALRALASLLSTQQYSQPGRATLLDLLTRSTLAESTRIQIAQMLYSTNPGDADLQGQAQRTLLDLAQSVESTPASAIQAAQALYECYPPGSAEQLNAVQMMLEVAKKQHISFAQIIQVIRAFLRRPSTTPEAAQLVSKSLFDWLQSSETTFAQARLVVDALSYSATTGYLSAWESAADKLLALMSATNVTFAQLLEGTYTLYQTPVQSPRRLQAARLLLDAASLPGANIEEITEAGEALSWNDHDEGDERQRIIALLMDTLQRPDLDFEQIVGLTETLYGSGPDGSSEQQQATQKFLQLVQQADLAFEERIQVAEALYRCSPLNSQENQRAIDTLLALAKEPALNVENAIQIFQILYDYDLTTSNEGQQALSTLIRLAQRSDISAGQRIQIAQDLYASSPPHVESRQQAAQTLWQQAQSAQLPTEQRLDAATTPLTVGDSSYPDRAQAVRLLLSFKQGEEARSYLEKYWQPVSNGNRSEPSDIPAMIELIQQSLLPTSARDKLYRTLRQMVPHFDTVS
jgi:NACHT domain